MKERGSAPPITECSSGTVGRRPSGTIIVTAVFLAVGGLLILVTEGSLLSLILRNRPWMTPLQVLRLNPGPFARLLVGGTWTLITAVGMYRLRAWARISLLTLSLCGICFGGFFLFGSYLSAKGSSADALSLTRDALILLGALVLLAASLVFLFTRGYIASQFSGGEPRPASVAVLGGFLVASAFFVEMAEFPSGSTHPGLWLVGLHLEGAVALFTIVLWLLAHVVLGFALLKEQPWARVPAAIYASIYLIDCFYTMLPGHAELLAKTLRPAFNFNVAASIALIKSYSLWFAGWATLALWILGIHWSEIGLVANPVDSPISEGNAGGAS